LGAKASLADFAGRPVLLNFWATWCLPCLGEMPELAALQERFGNEGLAVVGVNIDTPELLTRVRAMVAERKLPFTIWLDPAGKLVRPLKVEVLPTTLVFDRSGRLVWRRDRAITATDPELQAAIRRALEK
jgi:thiol-disulfide isomerase/thioredoxin